MLLLLKELFFLYFYKTANQFVCSCFRKQKYFHLFCLNKKKHQQIPLLNFSFLFSPNGKKEFPFVWLETKKQQLLVFVDFLFLASSSFYFLEILVFGFDVSKCNILCAKFKLFFSFVFCKKRVVTFSVWGFSFKKREKNHWLTSFWYSSAKYKQFLNFFSSRVPHKQKVNLHYV